MFRCLLLTLILASAFLLNLVHAVDPSKTNSMEPTNQDYQGRARREATPTLNLEGQFCDTCVKEYCEQKKISTCSCPTAANSTKCICKCEEVNQNNIKPLKMCHKCEFDCGGAPKICHCTRKSCYCICRTRNDTCHGGVGGYGSTILKMGSTSGTGNMWNSWNGLLVFESILMISILIQKSQINSV